MKNFLSIHFSIILTTIFATLTVLFLLNPPRAGDIASPIEPDKKVLLVPETPTPNPPEPDPEPEPEPDPEPTPTPVPVPSTGNKTVYLTFDDGPSRYTPDLLAVLKDNGVLATFFVIGRNDATYKAIVSDGHAIGLHSNTHSYASVYASDQAFLSDLSTISARVEAVVGFAPKIIRFPGGSSNTVSRRYSPGIMTRLSTLVHDRGYKYYDWNCTTGDGVSGVTVSSEINAIAACGRDTLYILAHDTAPETLEAMKTIIPALKSRGYAFLPITPTTPEYHHQIAN